MWIWEWRNKPLFVSSHALDELRRLDLRMEKVIETLEQGYDCTTKDERNREKLARCMKMKGKIYRVVLGTSYSTHYKCECWVLVHAKPD